MFPVTLIHSIHLDLPTLEILLYHSRGGMILVTSLGIPEKMARNMSSYFPGDSNDSQHVHSEIVASLVAMIVTSPI